MTEQEWLECGNSIDMLYSLGSMQPKRPGDRKYRLFAVACCQRVRQYLVDDRVWKVVEDAEQFADGLVTADCLDAGVYTDSQVDEDRRLPGQTTHRTCHQNDLACYAAARADARWAANTAAADARRIFHNLGWNKSPGIVALITKQSAAESVSDEPTCDDSALDDPFPQAEIDAQAAEAVESRAQAALVREVFGNPFRPVTIDPAWLTPTVVRFARTVYDDRAFDRLPILADALEEAGCTDVAILSHLRGPGPHVRGCWVVDLVRSVD